MKLGSCPSFLACLFRALRCKATSPFSKEAGLALDIYYMKGQPGEIRAEASGLYFRPDGAPVLDKVRLKVDAKDLLTKEALGRGLVNLIASADLPVASVKNVQWVDFATGKGAARGGFQFDLALKLGKAFDFLPDLIIDDVLLRTDGKVEFGKGGVIETGLLKKPILPIGTAFVLTNHKIRYIPAKRTGTLETELVPRSAVDDPQNSPLLLRLAVTLNLPRLCNAIPESGNLVKLGSCPSFLACLFRALRCKATCR